MKAEVVDYSSWEYLCTYIHTYIHIYIHTVHGIECILGLNYNQRVHPLAVHPGRKHRGPALYQSPQLQTSPGPCLHKYPVTCVNTNDVRNVRTLHWERERTITGTHPRKLQPRPQRTHLRIYPPDAEVGKKL
jgi:hypothetical protein